MRNFSRREIHVPFESFNFKWIHYHVETFKKPYQIPKFGGTLRLKWTLRFGYSTYGLQGLKSQLQTQPWVTDYSQAQALFETVEFAARASREPVLFFISRWKFFFFPASVSRVAISTA